MSKYTAKFQMGWMTVDAEGDSPSELMQAVEKEQDLMCLVQQCAMMGTKADKKEIGKVISFLEKQSDDSLTIDDIRDLNVKLSVGSIKCLELMEND